MSVKRIILGIAFFLIALGTYAQSELPESIDFEDIIEGLLPQQELEVNYNDLYDRLFTLYSEPLDLNTAQRADFQSLFFLTDEQISNLLHYREEYGKFMTIYELLTIDGFDQSTVQRLKPFITIRQDDAPVTLFADGKHEFIMRFQSILETKKGYTPPDTIAGNRLTSRYAGRPGRIYARYRYAKAGMYSLGFTVEKDPGEQIIWDPSTSRYGMDYYSFHIMLENRWIFKKIIIGDFTMDYGQGLIFGSGFRFGKGMEPIVTVRRNSLGLRPYRSVYENKDFSGVAFAMDLKPLNINMFYSYVRRDAVLRNSPDRQDPFISYIQTVGLHRTPTEIGAKHNLSDRSTGLNLNLKLFKDRLELGLNGIYTVYDRAILPDPKKYNQFYFRGLTNTIGGFYFNYFMKNVHIFGEMAMTDNGGRGISAGIIASLSSVVQASLHYRNYDRQFHSFYGNAFGESTSLINEQGFYWGLKIMPVRNLVLTAYYDFFKFPWLRYRVDAPSSGHDFMLGLNYAVYEKFDLKAQFRSKRKSYNYYTDGQNFPEILPKQTNRLWLDFRYRISREFDIKTRLQHTIADFAGSKGKGFLIAQDVNYSHADYDISVRFSLFDTDNYDSRQFLYEKDLLYVYSVPAYFNQGARYYFVVKYQILKNISFWIKFGQMKYFNIDKLGSGLEEINGNTKTDLGAQIRIVF